MSPLDEVFEKLKELSVEDLTLLKPRVDEELQRKAREEVEKRESELDDLRQMAGMRRRPRPRKDSGVPKKRGPRKKHGANSSVEAP